LKLHDKTLSIEAFYFKNHQEIYKAIIFMYKNKISIDILTLITFLQDNGLIRKNWRIKVVIELITQIPNLIYLEEYIRISKR
jgi:replicative DNA helicase